MLLKVRLPHSRQRRRGGGGGVRRPRAFITQDRAGGGGGRGGLRRPRAFTTEDAEGRGGLRRCSPLRSSASSVVQALASRPARLGSCSASSAVHFFVVAETDHRARVGPARLNADASASDYRCRRISSRFGLYSVPGTSYKVPGPSYLSSAN